MAKDLEKKGAKAWRERTEAYADLQWVYVGFGQISLSRRTDGTGGVSGIAPSEVLAWLELRGVTCPRKREEFALLVGALDAAFMEVVAERKASDGSKGSAATGDRRSADDAGRGGGRKGSRRSR
jgi:hypothetical protein